MFSNDKSCCGLCEFVHSLIASGEADVFLSRETGNSVDGKDLTVCIPLGRCGQNPHVTRNVPERVQFIAVISSAHQGAFPWCLISAGEPGGLSTNQNMRRVSTSQEQQPGQDRVIARCVLLTTSFGEKKCVSCLLCVSCSSCATVPLFARSVRARSVKRRSEDDGVVTGFLRAQPSRRGPGWGSPTDLRDGCGNGPDASSDKW